MNLQNLDIENRFRCLQNFKAIAIAVSGGVDSIALMYMVHTWRQSFLSAGKSSPEIHILTVDHGLRAEAKFETEWVTDQAAKLGFNSAILTWIGSKPDKAIQEKAREERYRLLTDWCAENNVPTLLTAHHREDQAETVLMRLARGSGVDGLSAMAKSRQLNNIQLLRPLLDLPKNALITYVQSIGASHAEDPSNANMDYERIRLRTALPALAELGITSEQLARTARRMLRAREALNHYTEESLKGLCALSNAGYAVLDQKGLTELPEEIALRCLSQTMHKIGGKAAENPVMGKLENAYLRILSGEVTTLSGCLISIKNKKLLITREVRQQSTNELSLQSGTIQEWDRRFEVTTSQNIPSGMTLRFLTEQGYLNISGEINKDAVSDPTLLAREVRPSLPSIWSENEILSVPHLGYSSKNSEPHWVRIKFLFVSP